LAAEVVSLPMHPYLTQDIQDHIVGAVRDALAPRKAAMA
jgi:dTDP-4-amino-4,6-dideoxygalactose transaminase